MPSGAQRLALAATLGLLMQGSAAQLTRERKLPSGQQAQQFGQSMQRALGYYDESCCELKCPEAPPQPPYYEPPPPPPYYPHKEKSYKEKSYKEKSYKESSYKKEKSHKKDKGYYRRLESKGYYQGG